MALVALCSLALLTGFQLLVHKDYREAEYLESYGSMVASQLARLGQDAMVREDAIALNVLAEQVAAEPAILQIEIYSMDGATLASYTPDTGPQTRPVIGSTAGSREFTRPIQLADATAGFVKVVVASNALEPDSSLREWMRLAAALLLSAVVLAALIGWLTRSATEIAIPANATSAAEGGAPGESAFYLLMVSLFNGNDMSTSRRDALMASAATNANAVAELYQGTVLQTSPTALAVVFNQVEIPERSFEAACAALVLARLGNQPGGARYRYSLQHLHLADGVDALLQPAGAEACQDALLHAALAEDNAVALAADFARALPRSERLELTSEHSPALQALHTIECQDYFLMSSAKPATDAMLVKQVEALRSESL